MRFQTLLEARWILAPLVAVLVACLCWSPLFAPLPLAAILAVLAFFRDPHRTSPDDPSAVTAPADGVVTHVESSGANGDGGVRISIFLSVLDVHINRSPVAGRITRIVHTHGRFHDARSLNASAENENQAWWIESAHGAFIVRQIAGLLARRIVGWKHEGDSVAAGERIGMIRFGSRTDLHLPRGAQILAKAGDRVRAGVSILARFASSES